jgi:transposase-like protein
MYSDPCPAAPIALTNTSSRMASNEGLKQRLLCRTCGKHFIEDAIEIEYNDAFKALVFKALEERVSLRGIERLFGVRRQTVAEWINKGKSGKAKPRA